MERSRDRSASETVELSPPRPAPRQQRAESQDQIDAMIKADTEAGRVILRRDQVIGEGGMNTVYRHTSPEGQQHVLRVRQRDVPQISSDAVEQERAAIHKSEFSPNAQAAARRSTVFSKLRTLIGTPNESDKISQANLRFQARGTFKVMQEHGHVPVTIVKDRAVVRSHAEVADYIEGHNLRDMVIRKDNAADMTTPKGACTMADACVVGAGVANYLSRLNTIGWTDTDIKVENLRVAKQAGGQRVIVGKIDHDGVMPISTIQEKLDANIMPPVTPGYFNSETYMAMRHKDPKVCSRVMQDENMRQVGACMLEAINGTHPLGKALDAKEQEMMRAHGGFLTPEIKQNVIYSVCTNPDYSQDLKKAEENVSALYGKEAASRLTTLLDGALHGKTVDGKQMTINDLSIGLLNWADAYRSQPMPMKGPDQQTGTSQPGPSV